MSPYMAKGSKVADGIKVADLKIGRLCWIIQVGPMQSNSFLKVGEDGKGVSVRVTGCEKDLTHYRWL